MTLAGCWPTPTCEFARRRNSSWPSRGEEGWKTLVRIAGSNQKTLPRIHALWGLEQEPSTTGKPAVAVCGERSSPCSPTPTPRCAPRPPRSPAFSRKRRHLMGWSDLLDDPAARVRFFAAMALGKLGRADAVEPLLKLLRAMPTTIPICVTPPSWGWSDPASPPPGRTAVHDESPAARMGILLALRRPGGSGDRRVPERSRSPARARGGPGDQRRADHSGILEPRRGPALRNREPAALAPGAQRQFPARTGRYMPTRLAESAARSDLPVGARVLALEMLAEWARPSGRDQVMGLWRPIPPRSAQPRPTPCGPGWPRSFVRAPAAVRTAAVNAIAALAIKDGGSGLAAIVADRESPDTTRTAALKALDQLDDPRRIEAAQRRCSCRDIAAVPKPSACSPGSIRQRREAASRSSRTRDDRRTARCDRRARGNAGRRPPPRARRLARPAHRRPRSARDSARSDRGRQSTAGARRFRKSSRNTRRPKPRTIRWPPFARSSPAAIAQRGLSIFKTKAAVECIRCHKVKEPGGDLVGGEVGPELSAIGTRQTREYLLESIVDPNKQIAQGFESVILATSDGKVHAGVLRGEDDKEVRLMTAEGKLLTVPKQMIEDRKRGPSAMPGDLVQKLSKTELRDLIEFLASLKAR